MPSFHPFGETLFVFAAAEYEYAVVGLVEESYQFVGQGKGYILPRCLAKGAMPIQRPSLGPTVS